LTHNGVILDLELSLPFSGFAEGGILYSHVAEFAALEYLAAFQAFHELGILVASHDSHLRMAALLVKGAACWLHGIALRLW
jgi:hypothetical protein